MTTTGDKHRRRRNGYIEPHVPLDDIQEHFFAMSVHAMDEDDWYPLVLPDNPLEPEHNFTLMWRHSTRSGRHQVCAQWLDDFEFEAAFMPEVLYHPEIGVLYDGVKQCGIERVISPGDCEVFEVVHGPTSWSRFMAALSGAVGDMSYMARGSSGDPGQNSETIRSRHNVRWGYPTETDKMSVTMPRHPKTGELLLDYRDVTALACRARLLSTQNKCLVSMFTQLPSIPQWFLRLAKGQVCKEFTAEMNRMMLWFPRFLADERRRQVTHDVTYIIAVLRKNSHGGPLLPIRGGCCSLSSEDWEKFDIRQSPVSAYLNEFLLRLGFDDAMFYDSLYGRRLVVFQAAIQRGVWERIRSEFDKRFREQRAAFRHIHGGRCAPEVEMDVEPRFLTASPDAEKQVPAERSLSSHVPTSDFLAESSFVRSTFLHFAEPDLQNTPGRSKSGSPPLGRRKSSSLQFEQDDSLASI